jgi:anti-anti-sigma factor
MPLTHSLSRNGDTVVLKLTGDFTFGENTAFRAAVDDVCAAAAKVVDVDMSGLGTVDSAALSMLMLLRERVAKTGGSVSLSRPSAQVARILEVVNFGRLFTINA